MSEAEKVAELAVLATDPTTVEPGKVYAFRGEDGQIEVIDGRAYLPDPLRKTGTRTALDAASFAAYVNMQGHPYSIVWVDERQYRFIAVLDEDGAGAGRPGWREHRMLFDPQPSEEWAAWTKISGAMLSQVQFAEFIEDHVEDIVKPTAATMLELAQSFQAHNRVKFKSADWLASGQRALEYEETIEAKAGQEGKIIIPAEIELALAPFERSPRTKMTAAFRFRIGGPNGLTLGIKLLRAKEARDHAFKVDLRDTIEKIVAGGDTKVPVLDGRP